MRSLLLAFGLFFSSVTFAAPIPAAIQINGLTWAQTGYGQTGSFLGMYESCGLAGDICTGSLDGWRWANESQVNGLLSYFFGTSSPNHETYDLSVFFSYFNHTGSLEWAGIDYFAAYHSGVLTYGELGLELTHDYPQALFISQNYWSSLGNVGYITPYYPDPATLNGSGSTEFNSGFFLVRDDGYTYGIRPPAAVPLPAAFWMFAPAMAGFITWRRKNKTL